MKTIRKTRPFNYDDYISGCKITTNDNEFVRIIEFNRCCDIELQSNNEDDVYNIVALVGECQTPKIYNKKGISIDGISEILIVEEVLEGGYTPVFRFNEVSFCECGRIYDTPEEVKELYENKNDELIRNDFDPIFVGVAKIEMIEIKPEAPSETTLIYHPGQCEE